VSPSTLSGRPFRRRKIQLAAFSALAAALGLAACSSSSGSGSSSGGSGGGSSSDFVVGAVQALTGTYGSVGLDTVHGLQAEANILNENGGILGHKVKVVYLDDGSDPQRAVAATQKLVKTNQLNMFEPDVILGNTQMPLVSSILSISLCAQAVCADGAKYPLAFSVNPPSNIQVPPLIAYVKQRKYTKAAVLAQDTPDGHSFGATAKAAANAAGITITGTSYFDPTATDVSSQVQQLRATGAQAVLTWAVGSTIGVVMKGMQSTGWKAPVVGTPAVFTAPVETLVPQAVQPQLTCICYAASARPGATVSPTLAPLVTQLNKFGTINGLTAAALAADTLSLADYGYAKAGKLDPKAAAAAIAAIGKDKSYPGKQFWVFRNVNPAFAGTVHSPANADLSTGFFAVAHPSTVVDGTYIGTPFNY